MQSSFERPQYSLSTIYRRKSELRPLKPSCNWRDSRLKSRSPHGRVEEPPRRISSASMSVSMGEGRAGTRHTRSEVLGHHLDASIGRHGA